MIEIVPAQLSDLEQIIEICAANLVENNQKKFSAEDFSRRGFLLKKLTFDAAQEMILNHENYIFLVAKNDEEILGYVIAFDARNVADQGLNQSLELPEIKQIDGKILYYSQIAKKPSAKNIGEKLTLAMIDEANKRNYSQIFCKIVHAPFRNQKSIDFHLRLGFKMIAELSDEETSKGIYVLK